MPAVPCRGIRQGAARCSPAGHAIDICRSIAYYSAIRHNGRANTCRRPNRQHCAGISAALPPRYISRIRIWTTRERKTCRSSTNICGKLRRQLTGAPGKRSPFARKKRNHLLPAQENPVPRRNLGQSHDRPSSHPDRCSYILNSSLRTVTRSSLSIITSTPMPGFVGTAIVPSASTSNDGSTISSR